MPTSRSTRKRNEGRLAYPTADLDTVTDTRHLAVIELRHFVKPQHVLYAYEIERGPLINAALGRLQFPIRPDRTKLGPSSPQTS